MNTRQIRAIRNYAKSLHLDIEEAALRWCINGCAARWREYEQEHEQEYEDD